MEVLRVDMGAEPAARVWMLLLHGGWAGAPAYWSVVWKALSRRHRVIAPELPGIAADPASAWTDYGGYVAWLDRLPDAGVEVGRKLQGGWPGSRLVVIDEAGHLPQVERPGAFVAAVLGFAKALEDVDATVRPE